MNIPKRQIERSPPLLPHFRPTASPHSTYFVTNIQLHTVLYSDLTHGKQKKNRFIMWIDINVQVFQDTNPGLYHGYVTTYVCTYIHDFCWAQPASLTRRIYVHCASLRATFQSSTFSWTCQCTFGMPHPSDTLGQIETASTNAPLHPSNRDWDADQAGLSFSILQWALMTTNESYMKAMYVCTYVI